jgi:hypothetical protein
VLVWITGDEGFEPGEGLVRANGKEGWMLTYVEFGKPVDDYCEAEGLSFGMSTSGMAGGAARIAQRSALSFTKARDSLSTAIFRHCMTGTVFPWAWVEFYRDEDSDPFMIYTLSDAVISAVQSRGSGESVSLNCRSATPSYFNR